MLVIPIPTKNHENDGLVIILEESNIDSMKKGDPSELKMSRLIIESGKMLRQSNILIAYENEEGIRKVEEYLSKNDLIGMLEYLQRGTRFRLTESDTKESQAEAG